MSNQKGFATIILLIGILIIFAVFGGIYYYQTQIHSQTNSNSSPVTNITKPSDSPSDGISNWKTYYDPILDLSFKYPGNWTLSTGSYRGDAGLQGTCSYINSLGFLKDPSHCDDKVLQSLSPGLTLTPPSKDGQLQFIGPTSGLGGGCSPEDCIPTQHTLSISGKKYLFTTYSMKAHTVIDGLGNSYKYDELPYSTGEPAVVSIATGSKSVWSKFDIDLTANNTNIFDTQIKILQSITY